MLDALIGLVKGAAPGLATALGGPMAGMAVKALAEKLGTSEDPQEIVQKIQNDPSALLRLEELENEKFKAVLADVQDARAMQAAAMQSEDPFVRRFVYYFIMFWSIFAAVFIPSIVFLPIPDENVRFADTILGFLLGTMVASMFAFLLGSSLGSKQKDKK